MDLYRFVATYCCLPYLIVALFSYAVMARIINRTPVNDEQEG